MRILMWLTIGFGAACALWAGGVPAAGWQAMLLWGGLLCAILGKKWKPIRRVALVCFGCFLGFSWLLFFDSRYLNIPRAIDGETVDISIRAADYSEAADYGTEVDGVVRLDGRPYQVRAYLKGEQTLQPGAQIRGSFRLCFTAPDRADSYYGGKGIFLLAYQQGEAEITQPLKNTLPEYPAIFRRTIRQYLQESFPADTAPFAQALLLGSSRDLGYQVDSDLKISGIRHVVAVSGLHVSILFALLGTLTFHRRFLTAILGIPVLVLFAAVAGFTPSVTRACIMAGLMLLAKMADEEYDGPTALAFAALIMLIFNPLTITAVSFQLSVASVAGIYLFQRPIYAWMAEKLHIQGKRSGPARWLCTSVSVTLSATLMTTPLCAWHFGTVSLVGVLTNLLTLWLISFVFYGSMAVSLLHFLSGKLAALVAKPLTLPIRFILRTAGVLADFPLAAVYTKSIPVVLWLIFVYLLLMFFLLEKKKRPGVLVFFAVLGLVCALIPSYLEPALDDTRFTMLDVGQGQCLILQAGGKTLMVDCGGDSDRWTADKAAETLLSQGIFRLDCLILTHRDFDHAGAAENLLTRIPAGLVIQPPGDPKSGNTIFCTETLHLSWDETSVRVFPAENPGKANENSLCVLFERENCVILITGDRDAVGEQALLQTASIPRVDVLMAGHHGSRYSTCDELLDALRPSVVCISVGTNPYGHPAPELLSRIERYGCKIYRTDRDGTITIRR